MTAFGINTYLFDSDLYIKKRVKDAANAILTEKDFFKMHKWSQPKFAHLNNKNLPPKRITFS